VQTAKQPLTAGEIAEILDGQVIGNRDREVTGAEVIERAGETELSFVGSAKNLNRIAGSGSRLIIAPTNVSESLSEFSDRTFVLTDEPEAAFLTVLALMMPPRPRQVIGISPQAVVADSSVIGRNTNVHPLAVIGEGVTIGRNCEIHAGAVIGDGCQIGEGVVIYPNTVLYHDVILEDRVIIHANCVIGADGFGYRVVDGRHQHLPHFGNVHICSDVEIGAGTTIDRAKVGETLIGRGTKIDDQVMIGHNCQIGEHNLIVSQVGFAGSVSTGNYVVCAGQAGVADHVHVHDHAIIGARAGVHRDLAGGQSYLGSPAAPVEETTRQLMTIRRLPAMRSSLKTLEKEVASLKARFSDDAKASSTDSDLNAA